MPPRQRSARARTRESLDDREAAVRELNAEGLSLRETARRLRVDAPTLSRWSKRVGVSWAPPPPEATEARAARVQAQRLELAEKTLADALHVRERLWLESVEIIPTRDGPARVVTDLPSARATNDLATAVERLVRSAVHAAGDVQDAAQTEDRRNMLSRLQIQIERAVGPEEKNP